jgi:hypothetical protein
MVYHAQKYWVFGLFFSSSGTIEKSKTPVILRQNELFCNLCLASLLQNIQYGDETSVSTKLCTSLEATDFEPMDSGLPTINICCSM